MYNQLTDAISPDFSKLELIPTVVQDINTKTVVMVGYMNKESLELTLATGRVTFFSRSRKKIWVKGETSGNFLNMKKIFLDCDNDALLVLAEPTGPVCHTGNDACFFKTLIKDNDYIDNKPFSLYELEKIINVAKNSSPDTSYTARLVNKGIHSIAQKVGEEAVEVVIEAMKNDKLKLKEESADLLYHLLLLLSFNEISLLQIEEILKARHLNKVK
jgi:phosphoribosyl-AMP cyclohydrolase / phosphoribosyl-ATP pyrophosphohydrolase